MLPLAGDSALDEFIPAMTLSADAVRLDGLSGERTIAGAAEGAGMNAGAPLPTASIGFAECPTGGMGTFSFAPMPFEGERTRCSAASIC